MHVLAEVARGLGAGVGMLWMTLWALVLGFTLSGGVQAFVHRDEMRRALGDHRPATIVRAGLLGAVSSSCSYAAATLAKSLFARGADFTAAIAFMVASTNLVIDLGLVLWLLLGWQFVAAEVIGGVIMLMLLTLLLPAAVRVGRERAARDRLGDLGATDSSQPQPWRERLRSADAWRAAAGYTLGDLRMVRAEILIGFAVAGLADTLIPVHVWQALFYSGHGVVSDIQNAIVGPLIAVLSFVCSVGNVPLAAALWHAGISFGGVVAFIFADLITFPIIAMYRQYYGRAITWRLVATMWLTMSAAGLIVQGLFAALHLVPEHPTALPTMTTAHPTATITLNVVALVVLAGLAVIARSGPGLASGFAIDPICGMQVDMASASASSLGPDGHRVYFCSDHCRLRFEQLPARRTASGDESDRARNPATSHHPVDPICGMTVSPTTSLTLAGVDGTVYFCSPGCQERYAATQNLSAHDPICGMTVDPATSLALDTASGPVFFCSPGCREQYAARR
jgi:uncharacterized protein